MDQIKLNVRESFTPNPVFIDGLSRCGKAAVGVAVSSFERVEHVTNRFIFDQIQTYVEHGWMTKDAFKEQLITEVDMELYHGILGRNLNWNKHDWSSVANSRNPEVYRQRLSTKDNKVNAAIIFDFIRKSRAIALNTTEEMLFFYDLYDECFRKRNKTIVVLRHPIELVFSWHRTERATRFGTDPRFLHPTFLYLGNPLPLDAVSYSESYMESSALLRIILLLKSKIKKYIKEISNLSQDQRQRTFIIGFDDFAVNTSSYLTDLEDFIGTTKTDKTKEMCDNQRLPREQNVSDLKNKLLAIKHHLSPLEFDDFCEFCVTYESNFKSNISIRSLLLTDLSGPKYSDFNYGKRIN